MPFFSCIVEEIPAGLRLDRYIAEHLKILSRSQIKARKLEARINGKAVKISRLLCGGENLELSWNEAETQFLVPQNLPLDIIYEDDRVIVVNKAQGMVVHPGAGNRQGTLANALLCHRFQKMNGSFDEELFLKSFGAGNSGSADNSGPLDSSCSLDSLASWAGLRPGIVHRLDKDTSGVIIAAWDEKTLAFLSDQFKARKVRKSYAALVHGCPRETSGRIEKRIVRSRRDRKTFTVSDSEGRLSLTYYRVIRTWKDFSLLLIRPKTGRTHQIRVHLKYLGNPVIGDPIYGREEGRFKKASLMLHAKRLSIVLPGADRAATFRTALPERFLKLMREP